MGGGLFELPVGILELLVSVLELSVDVLELPVGVLEMPVGVLEMPVGVLELPVGVLELPVGVLELPAGVLELPVGDLKLPLGLLEPPTQVVTFPLVFVDLSIQGRDLLLHFFKLFFGLLVLLVEARLVGLQPRKAVRVTMIHKVVVPILAGPALLKVVVDGAGVLVKHPLFLGGRRWGP